jgi:hypothetical protein
VKEVSMLLIVRVVCVGFVLAVMSLGALAQSVAAPIRIALIEGLSGPFANTGEAVMRNLVWAVERVNARRRRANVGKVRRRSSIAAGAF